MTPTPEEAIRSILLADASFDEIAQTRVYCQMRAPSGASPNYVTMQRVSGAPTRDMSNASSLAYARIQLNLWHQPGPGSWLALRDMVERARLALHDYRGAVAFGIRSLFISHLDIENETDLEDEPIDGGEDPWIGFALDLVVGYHTSVPGAAFVSGVAAAAADAWNDASGNTSVLSYNAVAALYQDLIDAGLWANNAATDKILRLNLFAGNDLTAALTPQIVGGGHASETNSSFVAGDYGEATGLTGDGSKHLRTGWIPGDELATSLDAHLGLMSFALDTEQDCIGAADWDGTQQNGFLLYGDDSVWFARLGKTSEYTINEAASLTGHALVSNRAANDGSGYADAVEVGTEASFTTDDLSTADLAVFAVAAKSLSSGNVTVNGSFIQAGRLGGYHAGRGLTAADVTALSSAITTFNQALSRAA